VHRLDDCAPRFVRRAHRQTSFVRGWEMKSSAVLSLALSFSLSLSLSLSRSLERLRFMVEGVWRRSPRTPPPRSEMEKTKKRERPYSVDRE